MASAAEEAAGRREDPRLRVHAIAELVTSTRILSAKINNISLDGASVTASAPLKPGSGVILRWEHIDAFGRVTWVEGARCGLIFQQPLTAAEVMLAHSLARTSPASAEKQPYPSQDWPAQAPVDPQSDA